MAEERRSAPRAPMSGVLVTYEGAAGDRVEGDTLDLAPGGLFVRTSRALGVGKRLALELHVGRDQVPWSALGRVVWVRERDESATRPQGMGVKLIDADDAVVEAIERMVQRVTGVGERTDPGIGAAASVQDRPTPAIGSAPTETEPSFAIDLVSRGIRSNKRAGAPPGHVVSVPLTEPEHPVKRGRRHAGRWIVTFLVLVVATITVYAYVQGSFDPAR